MTHPQGDGSTILRSAAGSLRAVTGEGGDGNGEVSNDGGPFAVEVYNAGSDGSPEWRIRLFNSKSESGNAGLVTVGSYREMIPDQEWHAKQGVVYLDITVNDAGEYAVVFDLQPRIPETRDEKRYVLRIAEIIYDVETKLFAASQTRPYGDIEVAGRWVK